MGRRNYLFSKPHDEAEDNTLIYYLPGSCEIMDVNPLN